MKELINEYRYKLLVSVILIVFIYSLFTNYPYALNNTGDEFSYLTMGAHFGGIDWSQLTSSWCYYYSFGYSILIAPLFLFFNNIDLVYIGCVVINTLAIIGSFLLSLSCLKKIFINVDKNILLIICVAIALYSSNIVNSKWAWGECILVFLYWSIIDRLICYTNNARISNLVLISLISLLGYSIHQRFLVIIIAIFIYLITLTILKKNKVSNLFLFMILIACGYFGILYIKNNYFIDFFAQKNIDANNINGVVGNLVNTEWTNVKNLIRGGIGKLYYIIVSAFYLIPFSFIFGFKKVKLLLEKKLDTQTLITLFILIVLIGAYLLNVIFMTGGGYSRHDCIIYGRYMEYVYGPAIFLGFIEIMNNKNKYKWLSIFFLIGLICAFFVSKSWTYEAITYSKSISTSSIVNYYFYPSLIDLNIIPYLALIVRTVIIFALFTVFKKNIKLGAILLGGIVLCVWSYNAVRYNESAYNQLNVEYQKFKTIDDLILEENKEIYLVYDEKYYPNAFDNIANIERLQIMLWDKPIQITENKTNKKGLYIVAKTEGVDEVLSKFKLKDLIYKDSNWLIFNK